MSAATAPAVKKIARSLDENQNGSGAQRLPSLNYMPTERTSTASYKSPTSGKKKSKPAEPEGLTTFSSALDYIRSPVRYLTSVFTYPLSEQQKSPPKPRQNIRRMASGLDKKSPRPMEISQLPETESAPAASADRAPEAFVAVNTELLEPVAEKKVELIQNVNVKDKKPLSIVNEHKKGPDIKKSNSQLLKAAASKTRIAFSTKNFRGNKRQSPSPSFRMPSVSPRILSASNIKFASYNNRSYRVTSIEKEDPSAKSKKSGKKVFKIDKDRSPVSSSKVQSSPTSGEKREDVAHNYVPLNAIEISRL